MKKKIVVCVLVLWCLAFVFSSAVFIWASPGLLVHVQTLPDVQYQPKVLSGNWVVPLSIVLGAIAVRRIRRTVVKTLVCLIAFSVACCPSYQVVMAFQVSNQGEVVERMRLASAMLLYSLGLTLFFVVVFVIQVKKNSKLVNNASEATSAPALGAGASSPQG